MKDKLFSLIKDESGQTAVEYALVIALIVIAVVGTATAFLQPLQDMWKNLGERLAQMVAG